MQNQEQQQYNYYDPLPNQPLPYMQPYPAPVSEPGRWQALAGVILGGIGLIALLLHFSDLKVLLPFVGYPVSIVGLILSIIGRRSFSRRKMATVGIVLCIIALVLTAILSSH